VSLHVPAGTVMGLVGESGSGKTTVGLAVLGHTRKGVRIAGGRVLVNDTNVLTLSAATLRTWRGGQISYVPQDPGSSLNPALRIGVQMREVLDTHNFGSSTAERTERIAELMADVALPTEPEFLKRYPHQLSGGQQQRIGLAMAFACRPDVIVLDEPTTGLDVSTQAHVLETIRTLTTRHQVAALYITHDLAVVADLADDVAVMYAGRIVERSSAKKVFMAPSHPYTRRLIQAAPDIARAQALSGLPGRAPAPGKRPTGCAFAPRCNRITERCTAEAPTATQIEHGELEHEIRCFVPFEQALDAPLLASRPTIDASTEVLRLDDLCAGYQGHQVVHHVSLTVGRGECVAVVGESGSGKTTLSRSVGGLHSEWTGGAFLAGIPLATRARARTDDERRRIQYIFQNPYASLNPRRTVGDSVARPLMILGESEPTARSQAGIWLERVALTAGYLNRYPNQLSGGERQRVAIARALIVQPDLLVCDEITSALDVLVQAAIVELLSDLRRDLGLSLLFVTHNLPLVRSIADSIAVLHNGQLVESGPTETIMAAPQQHYTRALISDTPSIAKLSGLATG
jgi:peptide/nickel transport system ATP-binding protein